MVTSKIWVSGLIAFSFFVYGSAFGAGTVTGKIELKGPAPKMDPIKMNADPYCVKFHAGKKVMNDDVEVNSNKTLKQVFVYVKEGVNKATVPPVPTEPVVFDQNGCMYNPSVLGVRAGQTFRVLNSDSTLHNVHAMPKANPGFNMGQPTKGNTKDQKFPNPEMGVHMKCDVHSWMSAYVNVMDHPYFAVSDDKGNFTISNLPPGEYTIEAWHHNPKIGTKTAKVTVKDGGTETVNFSF